MIALITAKDCRCSRRRTPIGDEQFPAIRSYVATATERGVGRLNARGELAEDRPRMPA